MHGKRLNVRTARREASPQLTRLSGTAIALVVVLVSVPASRTVAQSKSDNVATISKKCDAGEMSACDRLGYLYRWAQGVQRDSARGVSLFRRACEGGFPRRVSSSDTCIGRVKVSRGISHELPACIAKPVIARISSTILGGMYQLGVGVPQDHDQAEKLFQHACDHGYGLGCNDLAGLYRLSGSADLAKIFALFTKACDTGTAVGCNNLARMYERGETVPVNFQRAAVLFRRLRQGKRCRVSESRAHVRAGQGPPSRRGGERESFQESL